MAVIGRPMPLWTKLHENGAMQAVANGMRTVGSMAGWGLVDWAGRGVMALGKTKLGRNLNPVKAWSGVGVGERMLARAYRPSIERLITQGTPVEGDNERQSARRESLLRKAAVSLGIMHQNVSQLPDDYFQFARRGDPEFEEALHKVLLMAHNANFAFHLRDWHASNPIKVRDPEKRKELQAERQTELLGVLARAGQLTPERTEQALQLIPRKWHELEGDQKEFAKSALAVVAASIHMADPDAVLQLKDSLARHLTANASKLVENEDDARFVKGLISSRSPKGVPLFEEDEQERHLESITRAEAIVADKQAEEWERQQAEKIAADLERQKKLDAAVKKATKESKAPASPRAKNPKDKS